MGLSRGRIAVAGVAIAILIAPTAASAAPGDLDPSFGTAGRQTVDLGLAEVAWAVAVDGDGGVVAAGGRGEGQQSTQDDLEIARLDASGQLETSFGDGGKLVLPIGQNRKDLARAVAVAPDGRIVVVGYTDAPASGSTTGQDNAAIIRLLPSGHLDSSFGGGIVIGDYDTGTTSTNHRAFAALIDPKGRVVIAGESNQRAFVARYRADGSIDNSFGGNGHVALDFGVTKTLARGVALAPDGDILVAGSAGTGAATNFAVARIRDNGSLETGFAGDGTTTVDLGLNKLDIASDIVVLPDGSAVATGFTQIAGESTSVGTDDRFDISITRLDPAGIPAPTFGVNGRKIIDLGGEQDIVLGADLAPDGKVVMAGSRSSGANTHEFMVVRVMPSGNLDPGFTSGGIRSVPFAAGPAEATSVALAPSGAIVAAGQVRPPAASTDFALARLQGDPNDLETTIDLGPAPGSTLTESAVEFRFSGSGSGLVAFECSFRSVTWESCESPLRREGLADGPYEFKVRAINSLRGRDPSPATRSFAIDTTAPHIQIRKRRLAIARKGRSAVKLRCAFERSGPCQGKIAVRTVGKFDLARPGPTAAARRKPRSVRLATRKYSIEGDGRARKLKLRIKSAKKRRLLQRNRLARKVIVTVRAKDQLGNRDRYSKEMRVTLKKPGKRRR